MTDRTHPEAGSTHIIRYALELGLLWVDGDGRDKVREALDALDTLEAQLEAVGAGGVQALSAGPMVTSEQRRLIGVIAEKIEDGTLFQSGIYQKKDLARFVRNMLDVTPTAPAASPTPPAEQQAVSSAVLKAIREANMQLVRTGDDAFMLVPYKVATTEAATPKAGATAEAALGGVYAELPKPSLPRGGFPDLFTEWQMRDFADRTYALRMEQAAPKAAPAIKPLQC